MPHMTKRIASFALVAGLLTGQHTLAVQPASAADRTQPSAEEIDLIERFHMTLSAVMKEAKTLGIKGRYAKLEPAVKSTFSLPLMVRIASGSYWPKGTDGERDRLVAAFERMSVATYADRFDGFSGESFKTVGKKPGPQGTTLVETKLVRPRDEPVDIVYVLREVEGEPLVVDVLLESGVSELARYRSDYSKVLKNAGLGGLVTELDAKAAKLLNGDAAEQP